MTYTALYRRFRPQTFAGLVGQEHISRTLAAAVHKGSFVHAYLFCGPRGTGKTSTAKILAKAVNCLEPVAGEPCGTCAACLRAQAGESLDVLEIDAASNRGIDEIRDLRERVKYAPALEKYKVYIIDEVHMLTTPAFNALLKTLEEPPAHVLFILATTEPHKIPLTVLSRCQRFDFRRIADDAVAGHLAAVAESEGYKVEPGALHLIARKVEGGMRDALGLLDQCAGFGNGQITCAAVTTILGSVDKSFLARMTEQMLAGDLAALLAMVAQLHAEGHDLRQFLHDLLEYQRELLLLMLSPAGSAKPAWAEAAKPRQVLKLLQALGDSDGRLRNSLQPRLTLELALINACSGNSSLPEPAQARPGPIVQPAQESVAAPAKAVAATPPPAAPVAVAEQIAPPLSDDRPPWPEDPPAVEEPAPAPAAALVETPVAEVKLAAPPQSAPAAMPAETVDGEAARPPALTEEQEEDIPSADDALGRLQALWPQIVREVERANISTGSFLAEAQPLSLQGNQLTLCFGAEYGLFLNTICKNGPHRDLVEKTIAAQSGVQYKVQGVLAAPQVQPEPPKPPSEEDVDQGALF